MKVLGIHDGHDASAALLVEGRIVAAAQEERFSGLKCEYGMPLLAARYCLAAGGLAIGDLDVVALSSNTLNPVLSYFKRNATYSVRDWVFEQEAYWRPLIFEGKRVDYCSLFKDRITRHLDEYYDYDGILSGYMLPEEMTLFRERRIAGLVKHLGVDRSRVAVITHESSHHAYAYFGAPRAGAAVVLTSEGIGDYSNGTVALADAAGRIAPKAHTRDNHLGHLYQYGTLMLGMKPHQHEYKVMGLAPYASEYEIQRAIGVYREVLQVNGLQIGWKKRPKDLYFHFLEQLRHCRFDGVAGALQAYVEEMLCEWVANCVRETGVRTIRIAGGVAQNIKAGRSLAAMPEVEDLFICPAAGDTSNSIGAAYAAAADLLVAAGKAPAEHLFPVEQVYLGPAYGDDDVRAALDEIGAKKKYRVRRGVTADDLAGHLADGRVIARMAGRMEFGLRALGNRSILADPRNPAVVGKINRAIKFRDFWMPFTPSILAGREGDYAVNPKNLASPFMTMAFDSTPLAREHLPAAMHPADFTIRPQFLTESANPEYYALIKAFERRTGVGALLNTSFNLHGEPMVCGPKEAIRTFENSGLDMLLMNDVLVSRAAS